MKETLIGYKKVHIKSTDRDAYLVWLGSAFRGGVGIEPHQAWINPNDIDLDDVTVPQAVDVMYDHNGRICGIQIA